MKKYLKMFVTMTVTLMLFVGCQSKQMTIPQQQEVILNYAKEQDIPAEDKLTPQVKEYFIVEELAKAQNMRRKHSFLK